MLKKVFQRIGPEKTSVASIQPEQARRAPQIRVAPPQSAGDKLRVLFLCYGNSCRSPIAEGLALRYGSDVLWAASAGLMPIHRVDPLGIRVMAERNIDISQAFPKGLDDVDVPAFDLIINMSGQKMPSMIKPIEDWNVPDPIAKGEDEFRKTADLLEQLVMRLILQVRLKQHPAMANVRAQR